MWFEWLKRDRPAERPLFWQQYLADQALAVAPETRLSEVPFVVVDTETTGLSRRKDRILSIGAVKVRHWKIATDNCLELYLSQAYDPGTSQVEVHGILPEGEEPRIEEGTAIAKFLDFAGNAVLTGHHISFDIAMMNAACRRAGGGKLRNRTIDTVRLARRLQPPEPYGRSKPPGLDALCKRYTIPINDRHTAAGDAFLTAQLLLKLLARLEERGVTTLKDLLAR